MREGAELWPSGWKHIQRAGKCTVRGGGSGQCKPGGQRPWEPIARPQGREDSQRVYWHCPMLLRCYNLHGVSSPPRGRAAYLSLLFLLVAGGVWPLRGNQCTECCWIMHSRCRGLNLIRWFWRTHYKLNLHSLTPPPPPQPQGIPNPYIKCTTVSGFEGGRALLAVNMSCTTYSLNTCFFKIRKTRQVSE